MLQPSIARDTKLTRLDTARRGFSETPRLTSSTQALASRRWLLRPSRRLHRRWLLGDSAHHVVYTGVGFSETPPITSSTQALASRRLRPSRRLHRRWLLGDSAHHVIYTGAGFSETPPITSSTQALASQRLRPSRHLHRRWKDISPTPPPTVRCLGPLPVWERRCCCRLLGDPPCYFQRKLFTLRKVRFAQKHAHL